MLGNSPSHLALMAGLQHLHLPTDVGPPDQIKHAWTARIIAGAGMTGPQRKQMPQDVHITAALRRPRPETD